MQPVEIPESPRLHGEEAIWVLFDFIQELEGEKGKELTKKQTKALVKFARGLASSIEAEMRSGTSEKDIKEKRFVTNLKETITKYVSEPVSKALDFT